jgi:type IV pilus assembly protein PilQ
VSFTAVDATLSLTVKPRIAPGGAIFMDLDITKDQPGPPVGENVSVLRNTAKTSVLINNGDTVVIGGIFKKAENSTDNSIPGLSKLPLIGRLLFNQERQVDDTSEILIFITPRIMELGSLK